MEDIKSYLPADDQSASKVAAASDKPKNGSETTEDRLMRQNSPLSALTGEPSTAERLADSPTGNNSRKSKKGHKDKDSASENQPASTGANNAAQSVLTTAQDLVRETLIAVQTFANPAEKIAELNSDGDQVVMKASAQVKGKIVAGATLQYGYDIKIEQVGDSQTAGVADDANVQYQVSFDKRILAGMPAENPVNLPAFENKGELRGYADDTIIMTFETQEEAATAVRILQQAALVETASDATSVVTTAPGFSPSVNSTDSPVANPIRSPETAHSAVAESVGIGPTVDELTFLSDHITGYSSTVGIEGRGKFGLEGPVLFGYEIRADLGATITRTVTLPSNGEPGRLSYTISTSVDFSSKESLDLGPKAFDAGQLTYTVSNVAHHGELSGDVTFNWDIPASEWPQAGPTSSVLPETELYLSGELPPTSIELKATLNHQTQGVTDPSRTDLMKYTMSSSLENAITTGSQIVTSLFQGDVLGVVSAMIADDGTEITVESIERTGVSQEHGIDFVFGDVVEGTVKLVFEAGVDDTTPLVGTELAEAQNPAAERPNDQMVVVPRNGVNLRTAPGTDNSSAAILYHGTFIEPTGATATDSQGNLWVEVSGPDVNDKQSSGWVRADLVEDHPQGAMDETGRINPDLESSGYSEIRVTDGDNLWDLAHAQGVEFDEMVELNSAHLIAPDLIFPGDTVYVPGTEGQLPQEIPASAPEETSSSWFASTSTFLNEASSSISEFTSSMRSSLSNEYERAQEYISPAVDSTIDGVRDLAESVPAVESAIDGASDLAETVPGVESVIDGVYSSSSSYSGSDTPVASAGNNSDGILHVDTTGRPDLDYILQEYQVADDPNDPVENYTHDLSPRTSEELENFGVEVWNTVTGSNRSLTLDNAITSQEAEILDNMNMYELYQMNNAAEFARQTAVSRVGTGLEDGHGDAIRHSLWNAGMTQEFGVEFAETYANAHEALSGNHADREAMDLYNNEVGRRIALENPDASQEELADLMMVALEEGELIVIDSNGELAWSDQVAWGETGQADDLPIHVDNDPAAEANAE
jgi:hypothetical protein